MAVDAPKVRLGRLFEKQSARGVRYFTGASVSPACSCSRAARLPTTAVRFGSCTWRRWRTPGRGIRGAHEHLGEALGDASGHASDSPESRCKTMTSDAPVPL